MDEKTYFPGLYAYGVTLIALLVLVSLTGFRTGAGL